jgi:hypothetical protein
MMGTERCPVGTDHTLLRPNPRTEGRPWPDTSAVLNEILRV